jgi:hypothetical protein
MTKLRLSVLLLTAGVLATPVFAQDQDDRPLYAYSTYFICSPDGESRADEIIQSSFKPHYDAAVEQGDISSWSWMQHYIGGKWRRVLVITASDMDSILDASGALGEIVQDQTPEAGRAFSGICSSHEDYIWETVEGIDTGATAGNSGNARFTAYFRCDPNEEERADEIVRDVFASVHARHVGEGALTTWNWLKHNVGGDFRRILTMTANDHKTLMRTRAAILADFDDRRTERALAEFNEICASHHDYLWDILIQSQ